MSGMVSILLDLLMPILHLLIMKRCMKAFFGPAKKSLTAFAGWAAYYIFQACSNLGVPMSPYLRLIENILFVFFLTSLFKYGSLKKRCIFSLLVCTAWMLVEVIVIIPLGLLGLQGESLQSAASFIAEMCMFIFTASIGHCIQWQNKRDISFRYFLAILLVPMSSIYLIHRIFLISYTHKEYAWFAVTASILLLLISYVIFEVYDWMIHDLEVREQNRLYEQQLELCSLQAEERETLYLEMQRIRHDMKHHLSSLLGMVQIGKTEDASVYMQKLLGDQISAMPEEVSCSGNIVIDSLVNYKCAIARREGIDFEATVFLPASLPFHSGHLAIIFGNLLDNAIEACRELESGKYIRLEASYAKEVLFLTISNPYSKERQQTRGKFLTTKKDTGRHGIGLSSVEHAATFCNGQLDVKVRDGIFQTTVVLYGGDWEK